MKPSVVAKLIASIAVKAHEKNQASFNHFDCTYGVSLMDACDAVAAQYGQPDLARIVYLALDSWSNDTLAWAEDIITRAKS